MYVHSLTFMVAIRINVGQHCKITCMQQSIMDGTLLLVSKIVRSMRDQQNPIITTSVIYMLDDRFFSYISFILFLPFCGSAVNINYML